MKHVTKKQPTMTECPLLSFDDTIDGEARMLEVALGKTQVTFVIRMTNSEGNNKYHDVSISKADFHALVGRGHAYK